MIDLNCRFCGTPVEHIFVDLGMSPLSNAYISSDKLLDMEPFYPLRVFVCHNCFLVQLPAFNTSEEIFSDYAYFSSYSDSWLSHCHDFAHQAVQKFSLGPKSQVVEIASNDGYLLKYFKQMGISVLGVEPADNVAQVAKQAGIDTLVDFFGTKLAGQLADKQIHADLLIGNNVLAHVPDLNDFVAGLKIVLGPSGIISMEFPHLMRLMKENQFDTIYHEHFSYFSLETVQRIFKAHKLRIFDVEEIATHGGSLRIFACHEENQSREFTSRLESVIRKETEYGLGRLECFSAFAAKVRETKRRILDFFISCHKASKTIVGYGAPAKGNTLLNYCGIRQDLLAYTVDRSPHKQGRYLPGTHIPIHALDKIDQTRPDYLLILPWNIRQEIMAQMAGIGQWGGKFVTLIPDVRIYNAAGEVIN